LALATLLWTSIAALAQDSPRFPIRGYQVVGNTLLPQEQVSLAVMPFTGPTSTFETIQLALESLEKAYVKAGYGSVKIEVPEQDLQEGVVRLTVVEARLDRISVEGNKLRSEENIRRSLPALVTGQVVNLDALQANLDLARVSPNTPASYSGSRNHRHRPTPWCASTTTSRSASWPLSTTPAAWPMADTDWGSLSCTPTCLTATTCCRPRS
jgi:hypothetical protein